jgi:acid phosphatase
LGQYEYSYIYRGAPESLPYAIGAYGVWVAELAQNMRDAISGTGAVKYRHNIAHDGSVSRVLAFLQVDQMVWPGMGSEVVFEIWKGKENKHFLRVLWGGQVLRSSHPSFSMMDMVDVDVFLAYVDALVGRGAVKIPALCEQEI